MLIYREQCQSSSDAEIPNLLVPVAAGREDFFIWKSEDGVKYNRGHALIFGARTTENQELCDELKKLDYQIEHKKLSEIKDTLENGMK